MKYEFSAKSSGAEPYRVVFTFTDNKLSIACNCKAGIFGKLCKHKQSLLTGDTDMLANPDEQSSLTECLVSIPQTSYPELLEQIQQAEAEAEKAKKNLSQVKMRLERAMKEGA